MKIIVTGGSGFLGRHLLRALDKAGHEIKNIDLNENPEYQTVKADVCDLELVKTEMKDADAVFHLASLIEAGESVKQPQKYLDNNVTGTINVLEAMRVNGIKTFLFSSSAAIYGEPIRSPIKEDDRTIPINPYGMTKLAMEGLLASYVESHGFTGVALRYFNLFGPEEHHLPETHAIPRFIKQISKDQEVTVWGDGKHQRDYVYIDDIVEAHLLALQLAQSKPEEYHYFNLSTGKPAEVLDLVRIIENNLGKKANIKHHPDRPGDPRVLTADASKAVEGLGWQSNTTLEEGLKKTVEYFKSR